MKLTPFRAITLLFDSMDGIFRGTEMLKKTLEKNDIDIMSVCKRRREYGQIDSTFHALHGVSNYLNEQYLFLLAQEYC